MSLGVSGGPPAAWAPEGSTYSFYQHSRAKRSFWLLVASWALLGSGCPLACSGTSSSILCAGAVFGDTHVAVCYTWLLLCLSWRSPCTVKTNMNSIFVFLLSLLLYVTSIPTSYRMPQWLPRPVRELSRVPQSCTELPGSPIELPGSSPRSSPELIKKFPGAPLELPGAPQTFPGSSPSGV